MIHRWKTKSIILLLIIESFSLKASDNLHNWIKSHRWDLIEENFRSKSPRRESEVYSLIEYHEKAPEGDPEKRFLYLVSQVKGSFVSQYSRADLDSILSSPPPHQSIIYRLSFWKLYQELNKRNLLTPNDKLAYLSKISLDTDPVSRRTFEELSRVYLDLEKYKELIQKVESLGREEKGYYLKTEIWIRYAKALARENELGKAKDNYIAISQDKDTPVYIRNFIYQDLKKYLSQDAFLNLQVSDIFGILNQMTGEESNSFLRKHKQAFRSRIDNPVSFQQAGQYLASKGDTNTLIALILSNRIYMDREFDNLTKFGDILYKNNKYESAIQLLERFPEIPEAGKYRILSLSYEQLGNQTRAFDNLVDYLANYPFNLHYQDKLIDGLINKQAGKPNYAEEAKWKKAVDAIPNLPVKGRLLYWYLRFLQDTGRTATLKKELENYYEKIAGSYYTRVIREEFSSILKDIPLPKNPTENKASLYRYLSHTAGIPEESSRITKRNLGFAYFDHSFDLGVRLTNSQSRIRGDRILSLATDYFRLGEDRLGMSLIHFYASEKNLSQSDKEEIIVGVGELSLNHYYSAFYTRSLLRRMRISDDPILLPTSVSSRLFPRPHRDLVQKYSSDAKISEDIIYAIMRQESFYKENAVSRSNAQGLMQVMPATGRELARNLGVTSYSLLNPKTSIQFGANFLGYLLRSNDNELRWASIAYNGGPGNLRKWKRNHYTGDFNHFLEDIPYKESRDYCRITVSNLYAYEIMRKYHGL